LAKLKKLQLVQFRNFEQATLNFSDGLNLIIGDNAAGKTSLIEAIWVLSSGRSFRSSKPAHLIHSQHSDFTLFSEVGQSHQTYKMGLNRSAEKSYCKINGKVEKSQAQMAMHLPVQLLTPESHRILEEGPKIRRQFLDWGCFYYAPEFIKLWQTYQRTLKQRNQALKQKLPQQQTQLWDGQLVEVAEKIDLIRRNYVEKLSPFVSQFCQALMPEVTETLQISYRSGWPKSVESLQVILSSNYLKDAKIGHTQYGCHRADLRFKFAGTEAMLKLSRGQQKLFVCALLLAQASLFELTLGEQVIMLIDDLPAELDEKHRLTLLKLLDLLKVQHVITTTSADLIPCISSDTTKITIEKGQIL
jgi:DNA replication and repair protein RecF